MTPALAAHLGACYRQQTGQTKAGDPANAAGDFATALGSDGDLASEARALHAGLSDKITEKCFISKTHRTVIARALGL